MECRAQKLHVPAVTKSKLYIKCLVSVCPCLCCQQPEVEHSTVRAGHCPGRAQTSMADEAAQAAATKQAELQDVMDQHLCRVLESTMAEAVSAIAVQIAVLAVHKGKQLKDIAGKLRHKQPACTVRAGQVVCS